MKILITGGAGFIGSVVAMRLLEHGYEVVVLDNLSSGYREAVPEEARLVVQDLADLRAVDAFISCEGFDAVMHFAANIQVGESMHLPLKYLGDNVRNALNLFEAMANAGVGKLIFSSTAALFTPSDCPISEYDPVAPASPYGESKYLLERALHWLDATISFRYVALRYFNAAGSWGGRGESHCPETHLIPLILRVPLGQAKAVSVYGNDYPTPDGTCIRDYIHVYDLAEAHILALQSLDYMSESRVYNLGNGRGFSVLEVIEAAREVTKHSIPAVNMPRRPGDSARLVADSRKIQAELGWRPRFPGLSDIIGSAWEWHRAHPEGYRE